MRKSNREVNGEKVFRYSIRKYHFGAASVAVAALMFFANGAVKADPLPVSPVTANTEKVNAGVTNLTEGVPLEKSLEAEGNKEIVAPESAEETSNKKDGAGSNAQGEKEIKVSDKAVIPANQTEEINKAETNGKEKEVVTNKDKLESLLKEIDQLNLKDYTEATVKVLQEKVAKAKEVLVNATTQKEIDLAYNALVGYKNAGLKRVPKPRGELTPKPNTTNGKATVGIKAENTEPNGTNIAGHNHSLNGTTRAEGSGFRAVPEGDVYFNLDSGTLETEVDGAPNAKFLVVWRKGQNYKPQLTSDGVGIRLLYDRQIPDSTFVRRLFNTTGSINTVGSYDVTFELKDGSTGVLYAKKDFKVTVKPHAPIVTVENLENAAGTRAKVTATARNPQYSSGEQPGESSVDFYVNGVKKQTVTAVNGVAEWTPTEVFNVNDRITATNTARDKHFLPSRGTNINVPITATTSNMSSEVVIPAPTVPSVDLEALKTAAKADLATAATEEKAEIAGDKSLTTAKRAEKEKAVDDKKAEEEAKITAADDADKVEAAKTAGVTAIKAVHTAGDLNAVKNAAKADLATAATEEKAEIAGDKSLTTAKRAEKEKAVDDKKAEEEAKITAADDADKVEAAKTAGVAAIKAVHTVGSLDDVKAAAKAELATAAAEEKAEIAGDKSLTSAQRAEKEKAVDDTKAAEEAKITAADDADKVSTAKTAGVASIKGVHTAGDLNALKNAAKAELATAATEEKAEIAGDKSLTAAQRAEKEKAVDDTKAAEEAKITAADDADKVSTAKTAGVAAIKAVHTAGDLNAVKNAAKAELATAAAEEKAEIAGDKSLTSAQRAEKEKAVDDTKAAEEAKITAADDADKVSTAKTAGVAAIKAVHTVGSLDDVKAAAKALPNTGTVKSTLAIPVAITSALLSLGLVGGRRRKEDEEV